MKTVEYHLVSGYPYSCENPVYFRFCLCIGKKLIDAFKLPPVNHIDEVFVCTEFAAGRR